MHLRATLVLFCCLPILLPAQKQRPDKMQMPDLLILEDGSYLRGRVSRIAADTVFVLLPSGPTIAIAKDQVRKLLRQGKKVALARHSTVHAPSPATYHMTGKLPAEPLPLPFGHGPTGSISLMPGLDAGGSFSMGAGGRVGWAAHLRHMPILALTTHISRYDYASPSFAALNVEVALPLGASRWFAGAYAGLSAPYTLAQDQSLTDVGVRPMGGLWLGRLWYTDMQAYPVMFQMGLRWQQAHYSLITPIDFQIVKAAFLRYELSIAMYRFAQKEKKRQRR